MHSIRYVAAVALLAAFIVPVSARAQSSESVKNQAADAYKQREFVRSAELFLAAAKLGDDGRAECMYNAACAFALAGRTDDAYTALEQAVAAGMDNVDQLTGDSDLASLRVDRRWQPLMERAAASAKAYMDFWTSPAMQTPFAANLSDDEKIAGLSKLWAEAKFNFIHFDKVPGLDWDALYLSYLPKVRATTSTLEYYRVLQTLYVALKDGHTGVSLPKELRDEAVARPLLRTELVENRVIITAVADSAARAAGVVPGLEIVAVDGVPVGEHMQRFVAPYQSASTPQDLSARGYGWALLEGPISRPVELTLKDASGATMRRSVERRSSQTYWDALRAEPMVMRMLPGNVAYVALNTFGDNRAADMFEAAFGEIAKADALVIDVRENGGGNSDVGYRVLACLTDRGFRGSKWRTRDYRPAFRAWGRREGSFEGDPDSIAPNGTLRFDRPVVVLAGPRTYSAAEDFVVAFRAIGRGEIVGETTGGSTGQPLMFPLPGGGSARVCTKHDSYADGTEFVGVGIAPDRVAHPTITDIRSGRDSALEAALELLRSR
ncbi:MAG TPA: S41 family peptidase [Blastocatellia bacterium]|nr:S41 family peptidase [Blastocatellia bacterium]